MIYFVGSNFEASDYYDTATIQEAVEYCSNKPVLGVDTETQGLDFTKDKMIMFQIGDEDNQYVIDTRELSVEPFRQLLEDSQCIKVLHNAKFDYKFIKQWAGIDLNNVYDTMLVEKVLNCGRQLTTSLKAVTQRYLGIDMDKGEGAKFVVMTTQPFSENQILYGARDVEYLLKIRNKQVPITIKEKLKDIVALENRAVLAFADIEFNGLDLDFKAWTALGDQNLSEAVQLLEELDSMIITDTQFTKFVAKTIQTDMFTPTSELRTVDIKWTSPKQVLDVFKVVVPKLGNVNSKEMYKYRRKFPIIDKYVTYKEKMKISTSYGSAFLKFLKGDNKIHTSFNQILDTGRVSSSKPNMQQIPADNRFRNCFQSPKGWCFVSSDYSSQELNVIAFGSKDPVWIKALEDGEDLHSVCAELVYCQEWLDSAEDDCNYMRKKAKCNCPKHKVLRTNVKTINFGLAYGMGPNKLADTLNIPKEDAELLIEQYFEAFPAIGGFLEKLGNFGKKFGYIKTFPPYNRKRWFTTWYPKMWDDKAATLELGSIERASKNTPIQGCSADMTKLAMCLIREYIREVDAPVKVVMTVHDQIDTICKIEFAEKWVGKMTELMESAANTIITNGLLKADTNISKSWEK